MAETSLATGMAESDIIAMKETLRAQQQLLQKLYAELDQEREASSSAASEALDMILRLQGEKAAVKMEASHYKRMAEEKMEHAETTLEIFEELMSQKEMEVASLEFQVQAYKHKLLNLGCDLNAGDFEFPENLLSQRNDEQQNGEHGQNSSVRRLNSLPPIPLKNNQRAPRKRERSPSPLPHRMREQINEQEVVSQSSDLAKNSADYAHETLDSYWDQIKRLDEKVKVISDCKEAEADKGTKLRTRRYRSCSIYSQAKNKIPYTNSDHVDHCEGPSPDRQATADPSCSVNVHDVFEVPQTTENHRVSEYGKQRLERFSSESENRLTKPDPVSEGQVESHVKYFESRASSPKDMFPISGQKKEGMSMDCNAQAEFQNLSERLERLEKERISTRQEITHEGGGEEHLRLLKDVHSQLKAIQEERFSIRQEITQEGNGEEQLRLLKDIHSELKSMQEERFSIRQEITREGDGKEQLRWLKDIHSELKSIQEERISIRQEITHEGDGEEQLRLLNYIQSQLKSIQEEMTSSKTKKAPPKDDVSLVALQEAMLYFWI